MCGRRANTVVSPPCKQPSMSTRGARPAGWCFSGRHSDARTEPSVSRFASRDSGPPTRPKNLLRAEARTDCTPSPSARAVPVLPPLLGLRGTHARARSLVGFGRYTAVIRTCERARRWDVALALMDEMASAGYNFYGASRLWHDRMVCLSEPLRVTVARFDDTSPLAARQDGLSRSTAESNRRAVRRDIPACGTSGWSLSLNR